MCHAYSESTGLLQGAVFPIFPLSYVMEMPSPRPFQLKSASPVPSSSKRVHSRTSHTPLPTSPHSNPSPAKLTSIQASKQHYFPKQTYKNNLESSPHSKKSPHSLAFHFGQLQHSISYFLETDLDWTEEDRHDAEKRVKPAARREKRSRRTMLAHEHIRQLPKRYTAC